MATPVERTGELMEVIADRRPGLAREIDVRAEHVGTGEVVRDGGELGARGNNVHGRPQRRAREGGDLVIVEVVFVDGAAVGELLSVLDADVAVFGRVAAGGDAVGGLRPAEDDVVVGVDAVVVAVGGDGAAAVRAVLDVARGVGEDGVVGADTLGAVPVNVRNAPNVPIVPFSLELLMTSPFSI